MLLFLLGEQKDEILSNLVFVFVFGLHCVCLFLVVCLFVIVFFCFFLRGVFFLELLKCVGFLFSF